MEPVPEALEKSVGKSLILASEPSAQMQRSEIWTLILVSNLEIGSLSSEQTAKSLVTEILNRKTKDNIYRVISVGNLTENGTDGTRFGCCSNGYSNEVEELVQTWITPLDQAGLNVKLVGGQKDFDSWFYRPVEKLIESREKSKYYTCDIGTVIFVFLGLYPDEEALKFLISVLHQDKKYILVLSAGLLGRGSDCWSKEEKELFRRTIASYKILYIISGTGGRTEISTWNEYPLLILAGDRYSTFSFNEDTLKFTIDFFDYPSIP